jgi:hypothetical protein
VRFVVLGFAIFVIVFLIVLYVCLRVTSLFDKKRIEKSSVEMKNDGVYMNYKGRTMCLDKKSDAEITYVSPIDRDKIISDFNRGVKFASLKDSIKRKK